MTAFDGAQPPFATPHSGSGLTGVGVFEVVVGAVLFLLGVRSLVHWMRAAFEPDSSAEQVLYLAYVTARVGMWLAFAAFFVGYALVDEPQAFRWFVLVPIALAGVQLLAGLALARSSPRRPSPRRGDGTG